jgi:hypothetical protein
MHVTLVPQPGQLSQLVGGAGGRTDGDEIDSAE